SELEYDNAGEDREHDRRGENEEHERHEHGDLLAACDLDEFTFRLVARILGLRPQSLDEGRAAVESARHLLNEAGEGGQADAVGEFVEGAGEGNPHRDLRGDVSELGAELTAAAPGDAANGVEDALARGEAQGHELEHGGQFARDPTEPRSRGA